MPYRDELHDPETVRLEAVVQSKPRLLAERAKLRTEYDVLAYEADTKGRELAQAERQIAEVERGGALVTITRWLGADTADQRRHAIDALRSDLERITARRDALVTDELAVTERLREVVDAEAELARLRARRAATLRGSDLPIAGELRALDAAVDADRTRLAALEDTLAAADRASAAVRDIETIVDEGKAAGHSWMPLVKLATDGLDGIGTPSDASIFVARLCEQVPVARVAIEQLLLRIADRQEPDVALARQQLAALVRQRGVSTERSPLALQAGSAAACIARVVTAVARDRDDTRRHFFEIVDQIKALEASAPVTV